MTFLDALFEFLFGILVKIVPHHLVSFVLREDTIDEVQSREGA